MPTLGMPTLVNTDFKHLAPEQKKPPKAPAKVFIGVALLSVLAFFAVVYLPDGKNDTEYLDELIERKEKGEILPSGEEKDFCILMASLRDSILLDCMPVLEGINWERPPKSPEELGTDWVEATTDDQKEFSNRRVFYHKSYPKIMIAFDKGVPDAMFKGPDAHKKFDHWHRFNPNNKNAQLYLDKSGKPVHKNHRDSHIEITKR